MQTVAIAYHFFAHYRGPIMQELVENARFSPVFYGDSQDPHHSGIEAWHTPADVSFVHTPTFSIKKRILLQRGLLRLSLRRDVHTIVFLGNARFVMTWIAALLARLTGKRVLFWTHGWSRHESGIGGWIRRRFYRLADGLLLYGNRARDIGIQEGFPPQDLYVIFNSLNCARQQALRQQLTPTDLLQVRRELFSEPERPLLIGTARLTHAKRFDLLLAAAHELGRTGQPVNVLLVGDGPARKHLAQQAAELSVDTHFYGACYDEAVLARLIASANVSVVPGSIGLTAIHSLVYGTPVVSHDDGDVQKPEWEAIVPEVNGSLFPVGDVVGLAKAIRFWLHAGLTPPAVRQRCYTIVDTYYTPSFQRQEIDRAVAGVPARGYPLPDLAALRAADEGAPE